MFRCSFFRHPRSAASLLMIKVLFLIHVSLCRAGFACAKAQKVTTARSAALVFIPVTKRSVKYEVIARFSHGLCATLALPLRFFSCGTKGFVNYEVFAWTVHHARSAAPLFELNGETWHNARVAALFLHKNMVHRSGCRFVFTETWRRARVAALVLHKHGTALGLPL